MISGIKNIARSILKFHKTRMIVCAFLIIILTGTLLLMLPVSSIKGTTSFTDALFTATSATCVTGLAVFDTGAYWTGFGQAVILCLIQIGGIGFMTVVTMVFVMLRKKINLSERMMIKESLGAETDEGLVLLTKHIFTGTFLFEFIGAVLLSIRFVPAFGFKKGVGMSVFHSVSAFCNAGFDIIGKNNSIQSFANDSYVCLVLSALIIIGGLGFIVWEDFLRVFKEKKRFSLQTKIVLSSTAILLILGTIMFFVFEYHNPETMGNMSVADKAVNSFFQSVTARTAGFASVDMASFSNASKLLFIILMFIGGAPASTAGGIKVVTVFVLFAAVYSSLKGKNEIVMFKRKIDYRFVMRAVSVVAIAMSATFISVFIILSNTGFAAMDVIFEAVSAVATVGLSLGITSSLPDFAKLIITALMFFGRVGVITVALSFMGRVKTTPKISYPEEKIIIG